MIWTLNDLKQHPKIRWWVPSGVLECMVEILNDEFNIDEIPNYEELAVSWFSAGVAEGAHRFIARMDAWRDYENDQNGSQMLYSHVSEMIEAFFDAWFRDMVEQLKNGHQ